MLQKLSFLLITAILLAGCGAPAMEADNAWPETSTICTDAAGVAAASEIPDTAPAESAAQTVPETSAVCAAEYFTFTAQNSTVTDDSGLTLLIENKTVPTFTSGDAERSAWVNEVLERIDRDYCTDSTNLDAYAREFISLNGTEHFYSFSNYQQLGVARHDSRVVSLIALSSLYSGGTHPNSVQVAYNLDIENRRILHLEDIITESGAGELGTLVRAGVDEKFAMIDGGNGLFEDYADTIDNSMVYGNMTAYWYLNDVGLVVFYNQYELGPYAAGIIKVELPYEALDGILNPEYLPAEPADENSGLTIRNEAGECHRIPITIEREGETLLIGVEGTVYQVQLSEVLWLEDTPIAQQLLFSAKSLCRNDVLEITGGYTDETRSFAIEYIDGRGEAQIVYIHDGELTAEP
jgi:hypothetical protein